jgi:hypothetical protein
MPWGTTGCRTPIELPQKTRIKYEENRSQGTTFQGPNRGVAVISGTMQSGCTPEDKSASATATSPRPARPSARLPSTLSSRRDSPVWEAAHHDFPAFGHKSTPA